MQKQMGSGEEKAKWRDMPAGRNLRMGECLEAFACASWRARPHASLVHGPGEKVLLLAHLRSDTRAVSSLEPSTASLAPPFLCTDSDHQLIRPTVPLPLAQISDILHTSLPNSPSSFAPSHRPDLHTPSPSPRKNRVRGTYSPQHSPVLITRTLSPNRAKPTLAMSIQIHAPAPIMSSHLPQSHRSSSRSRSRPSSPLSVATQLPLASPLTRPPMTRPPSRSERLLRDTLRKAEEQERLANLAALPSPSLLGGFSSPSLAPAFVLNPKSCAPAPHARRHVRRNTSSSSATDASFGSTDYFKSPQPPAVDAFDPEDEDDDEVDEQGWLWRTRSATSASSSSSVHLTGQSQTQTQGYYYASRTGLARQNSTDKVPSGYSRSRAHTDPTGGEKISGMSPPGGDLVYGTPGSPRAALQRSSKSAPNVSRPSHSKRPSAEFITHENGLLMKENSTVTPHEAVLRSRLEGVLRGAKQQERNAKSRERGGSGSGDSMASSRNLSGEGDFFFGGDAQYVSSPVAEHEPKRSSISSPSAATTTRTPSSTHTARQTSSPRGRPQRLNNNSLLTPPPTPPSPFNAHTAAAQCRAMDGYVSFANIEGLGVPDGEDGDGEEEAGRSARWLKWLNVGRGRSDSTGSVPGR
ncbi:hypothetical protein BXZ70DRAFT_1013488 [Cristinia sonorae]|uniref:Uncharacterized protein n=1 Tax=Cristinia sonorae TaxID=1940300 RepID=A0A8K0XVC1_9AGAR|nr:hypothetical protein BXZ70DRAFT_1013488 [Cristinia sonorae]